MSENIARLIFRLVCFSAISFSAQRLEPGAQPSWTISLKGYGYRGAHRGFVNDPGSLGNIAFSRSTVAVIFDEKAEETQLGVGDKKIWYGWRLSIVFLDAKTGSLVAKRTWIGDLDWHRRLIPTVGGNFVFLLTKFPEPKEIPPSESAQSKSQRPHPATLILLSSSGDELRRIDLPTQRGGWQILASTSGKSVLLIGHHDQSLEFRLLDADTFNARAEWSAADAAKWRPSAITDEYVLFSADKEWLIGRFGSDSKFISLPDGHAQFLSSDSILTVTPPTLSPSGTVTIMSITGKELASIDLGIHDRMEGAEPPIVAADGQRFGTIVDQLTNGRFLRRYQRTAYVWQEPRNDVVLRARIPYSERPEAAISADGSALTILNAGKVTMYRLPASGTSSP